MSAIFGILRFDAGDVSPRDLERMSNTLANRGPDGRKFTVDRPVGLGHCLMRVNQEDLFEAQPLRDRDADLTLVADLRIDNREELAGIFGIDATKLRDLPDSALVMNAYKKWGEDCAGHLLGDFAFAIWDGRAKKLVLCRDHMGQRYVHYHSGKDFFAFATEVRALWAVPDVPRKLSEEMIGRYLLLARSPASNTTLFQGVCFLRGGSIAVIHHNGRREERRYWEPHANPAWLERREVEYVEQYRSVLAEAVKCRTHRLIAAPALNLSGGFDSAAIAGLSGPVMRARGLKLIAVSSVMAKEGASLGARHWIELCRRDMPHLDVRYCTRTAETDFARLEASFPSANGILGPMHAIGDILFETASSAGARLMMDGTGGDATINPRGHGFLAHLIRTGKYRRFFFEVSAGNHSFRQILWGDLVARLAPVWMRRLWRSLCGSKRSWETWPITPQFAAILFGVLSIKPSEIMMGFYPSEPQRVRAARILNFLTANPFPNQADNASAHGLDVTRPMLDKRVVEFGLSIPEDLYVKNGRDRHLARCALADVYPVEFQNRQAGQDPLDPDFFVTLWRTLPDLKADVGRLAQVPTLRKHFDFEKLERTLRDYRDEKAQRGPVTRALRAIHAAKYIDWFDRANT